MNNKYKLDVKKIHEYFMSGEGVALDEINNQMKDRDLTFNNEDYETLQKLIELYDFVYFCEQSDDWFFSDKFTESWDLYSSARDRFLDNLDIGKEVAWDSYEQIISVSVDNLER